MTRAQSRVMDELNIDEFELGDRLSRPIDLWRRLG